MSRSEHSPEEPASRVPVGVWTALSTLLWVALAALFVAKLWTRPLSPDEHQFVAPSVLLLREGWLPYLDYAHFHAPYAVYLNALPLLFTSNLLVGVRLLSALCALTTLWLVRRSISERARESGASPSARWLLSWSLVGLAVSQWVFEYTTGVAWNHDNSFLALIAGLLAAGAALRRGACGRRLVIAGAWLGVATGLRLSMAPAALLLVPAVALVAAPGTRLRAATRVMLGGLIGGLPLLAHALLSPSAFWFGNLGYPELSTRFREAQGYERAMDLPGKLVWLKQAILTQPTTLLLLGLTGLSLVLLLRAGLPRVRERVPEVLVGLALLPALWIGTLAPTPTWPQYSFAPILLLVPLAGWALALMARHRLVIVAAVLSAVVAADFGGSAWRTTLTTGEGVFDVGDELDALHGLAPENAQLFSTAPIPALQRGFRVHPAMVNGPFGWRVAHLLDPAERAEQRLLSPEGAVPQLLEAEQAWIFVQEGELDEDWARQLSARTSRIHDTRGGRILWLGDAP